MGKVQIYEESTKRGRAQRVGPLARANATVHFLLTIQTGYATAT